MGLTYVTTKINSFSNGGKSFEAQFLVDTGATDSVVPESELRRLGINPIGKTSYEFADGSIKEYSYGLAQIEFIGEITAGRVLFGSDTTEPILGVTVIESIGVTIDPANQTLKRLPAIPLK
ncbi:MAG: aspartyl protease family protein [Ignavibacteriales bacterium]|nr:aspartyl protease family protein [Ignavibacteriales bacterium]